jgi:putative DNA primase/helicase
MQSVPRPKGDDDGFWRRIKVCLFRRQVPDGQRDFELPDKIAQAELPGMLNWLLDGLEDYLCKGGMRPPKALVDFIANYRVMARPFNDWLETRCVWGPAAEGHWTSSKELLNSLKAWWTEQGNDEKPP